MEQTEIYNKTMNYLSNKHLETLLLNGHPKSNTFHIDIEASKLFIEKQETERKKQVAKALIDTARYIPHIEFIEKTRILVDLFFTDLNNSAGSHDYIIATENTKKSGYFCTMILYELYIRLALSHGDTRTGL